MATVLVHSSDLHIDEPAFSGGYDGLIALERVLATATAHEADVVLLAGDTFDNARVPAPVLRQARDLLAAARQPIVLLPGNHDPLQDPCLFRRAGLLDLSHVHVLGLTGPVFADERLGLEVHGLAHRGFDDFPPVGPARRRALPWHVVMAHGQYVAPGEAALHAHRSWRFDDAALAGVGADYIALGHWDRPLRVGTHEIHAYYSGSPELARTINLVRLDSECGVCVSREAIAGAGG
jgi:DNA repair exonuclease SbcCD nuclease subunit